jgi:branched-chain amino acid transport system substrate-binding protein
MPSLRPTRRSLLAGAGAAAATGFGARSRPARADAPIKIGLVAALSGQSALSGEGITRGLTMAINEINAAGGVLGRKIELVRRDDESNPAKGQLAARELIDSEHCAVLFGGIDSPVSLAIVPLANEMHTPLMGVWAAATKITQNGANPNYAFRVSAVDALVDKRLLAYAVTKHGAKAPGLMLINNGWGESNRAGLTATAEQTGVKLAGIEKFEEQDADLSPQASRLKAAGADSVILVANAAPGALAVKAIQRLGWAPPVISHWGISGGQFPQLAGSAAKNVEFVQTYSFFGKQNAVGTKLIEGMKAAYPDVKGPGDILPPVGVANAYDAMHLTALAIAKAGSVEGAKIREGFYAIDTYDGLIKTYKKPFSPEQHDALTENDYIMVHYVGNQIEPVA